MSNNQADSKSKYWEIAVDYTPPGKNKLNSYLRLGTAEPNPLTASDTADMSATESAQRGHDLAAMVQDFIDDTRTRGPHLPAQATRDDETAALHTKGGWRDHSDGNRISTTRGDKVEVIRGNYRMLVLGRQDDAGMSAEWDASGGLIQDGDIAPGSITEIKWEQNPWSGTWTVTEECAKGNVISKYHGNVREEFYGDTIETVTGSPGGSASFSGSGWTDGDAAAPQVKSSPTITETTYATSVTAVTNVDTFITESTVVAGAVNENVAVGGAINENTVVGGVMNSNTAAAAVVDTLAAGFYMEASVIASAKVELEAQPIHISMEVSPLMVDFFLGVTIDIGIGPTVEVDVGGTYEFSTSQGGIIIKKDELAGIESSIAGLTTQVATSETAIAANATAIATNTTNIDANSTAISTNSTELTALKNTP